MKCLGLCSILALLAITTNASADWVKGEIDDQMRGTSKAFYLTETKPVSGDGPSIGLRVFDDKEGQPGVAFTLSQGSFGGCKQQCEIELRFDSGAIKKVKFASASGRTVTPAEMVAFAGALKLSKTLYVEFDVGQDQILQYKFDVGELPLAVSESRKLCY